MTEMIKIREDLNDMVKDISFKNIKTRYNERKVAVVTLFNDETVEFKDSEGLYDLFMAYRKTGHEKFIKSKMLVEEAKTGAVDILDGQVDDELSTYVCVLFELENGRKYRLFPARKYADRSIIDLYYENFKAQQKQNATAKKAV